MTRMLFILAYQGFDACNYMQDAVIFVRLLNPIREVWLLDRVRTSNAESNRLGRLHSDPTMPPIPPWSCLAGWKLEHQMLGAVVGRADATDLIREVSLRGGSQVACQSIFAPSFP